MSLTWTPSSPVAGERMPGPPRPKPAPTLSPATAPTLEDLARRVRAEYLEMPGLNLTRDQAKCLWALDGSLCDRLLAYLVETGFLARTSHATYVHVGG